MPNIVKYKDLEVYAPDPPLHSRENGGHLIIRPIVDYEQRYDLPLELATRLMHLSLVVGEAMTNVLRQNDINIVRINYQDMGNWAYKEPKKKPRVHLHLFGRTYQEKHPTNDPRFQSFPDSLTFPDKNTGFYDSFKPLTEEDCTEINTEISKMLKEPKYSELKF